MQTATSAALAIQLCLYAFLLLAVPTACAAQQTRAADELPRLAFVGLHGGVFECLQQFEEMASVKLEYLSDRQISDESVDLSVFNIVFLQHTRDEDRDQYRRLIAAAKMKNPQLKIISISGLAEGDLADLASSGVLEFDEQLKSYYGSSVENLRRMLIYVRVKHLGLDGTVLPPSRDAVVSGLYHPDRQGMFRTTAEFLEWCSSNGRTVDDVPRVVVSVHSTHLVFQQRKVIPVLIHQLENQGFLAVAMTDYGPNYERDLLSFQPDVVIHTCHSRERVALREQLGVPHLHSIFFRKQSIDQWKVSLEGLSSSEMAFHVVGQELLGAIEPQVGAGTKSGGGSEEAFSPIPERIDHLVARAKSWAGLSRKSNEKKRIAMIYYDREMGKSELMRGSATGMFLNGPRSMIRLLGAMEKRGYQFGPVPQTEDELVDVMMEYGRQIGVWNPGVLDRLVNSGQAVLVPVDRYQTWFESHVPREQREQVIQRWGPAPGNFLVWQGEKEEFIVIPRIDLGNVILLPQPLRGEAHDTSLIHDVRVPPPHNYLATYFWLQEEFKADAMIHFGTHGSEFMLPGKPVGLSENDWSDIVMGNIPNLNPWVINNLGESSPVKRRAYAVLIDHLVPPSVNAELSDELLNLHNDIDKWVVLPEGALKEKFRETITRQVRAENLLVDVKLELAPQNDLSSEQIQSVLSYLHDIHNETTPVSLHVLGQPPRKDLLVPYLVTCLRIDFLRELESIVLVPASESLTDGDRDKFLRAQAEAMVGLIVNQGFTPAEAVASVGGAVPASGFSQELQKHFQMISWLIEGFEKTPQEIGNVLNALEGRFIAPGPGNSADRNPASLPSGRNMYVMNPEEVPTRPSWELGCQLVDQLLTQQLESNGKYPEKVGFTLSSFATFQDYGVMESQIFYLIGVRPVWDAKNLVTDVEVIPLSELDRPRIDVFIAGHSYYRDMLPTRMRLIDKAIRLVADCEGESVDLNQVRRNSLAARHVLIDKGYSESEANMLSTARIFGYPEGQVGSASYYYLVERSGEWDSREELAEAYLSHVRNVYTDGMWGKPAADAYNRHLQGTEVVLRSWSDRTRSPLSNKYTWYQGGSLALAVKHLTGTEPEFFLSDVRDPDGATMVRAEDALRKDFRVRLFNRKWIEGMMKEGYSGADQVAVHVSNTLGWKIMRPNSVSDDIWEEIVDVYVHDKKNLNINEWFESENPFAYQETLEILLETIRKEYWQPDAAMIRELVIEYAQSVKRHGEGGGLRGGGNKKLEAFVREVLLAPDSNPLTELVDAYQARVAAQANALPELKSDSRTPANETAAESTASNSNSDRVDPNGEGKFETIEGRQIEKIADANEPEVRGTSGRIEYWLIGLLGVSLVLFFAGYWLKIGAPRR